MRNQRKNHFHHSLALKRTYCNLVFINALIENPLYTAAFCHGICWSSRKSRDGYNGCPCGVAVTRRVAVRFVDPLVDQQVDRFVNLLPPQLECSLRCTLALTIGHAVS